MTSTLSGASLLGKLYVLLSLLIFGNAFMVDSADKTKMMQMDEGIFHGAIVPFGDEWNNTFWDKELHEPVASPVYFWFRCLDDELRGYAFVESMKPLPHGKEADMPVVNLFRERVTLLADGEKINFKVWHGGVDFTINVKGKSREEHVHISIKGWKHYAMFPLDQCKASQPKSEKMKLIMNIHTRTFDRVSKINPKVIQGVVNHFAYHKCALGIDEYELVIQKEQIPLYMKHHNFSVAVKQGWIKLVTKNEYFPSPMYMPGTDNNCYWQAITQNMAILQHWKENVRLFMMDTDEYLTFSPDYTTKAFLQTLQDHPIVAYDRWTAFCQDCPRGKAEVPYLTFTGHDYKKGEKLMHPKLAIDPSVAGCFIVHWAGCGGDQHTVPQEDAFISHFENMYNNRWHLTQEKVDRMKNLTEPVLKYCDPALFDWQSKDNKKYINI